MSGATMRKGDWTFKARSDEEGQPTHWKVYWKEREAGRAIWSEDNWHYGQWKSPSLTGLLETLPNGINGWL